MAYATKSDIETTFGARNVAAWADLDETGDTAVADARINDTLANVEADIDSMMERSGFAVPLSDEDGAIPTLLTELAASLAGIRLYESRGVEAVSPETGQPIHKFVWKEAWARRVLGEIQTGVRDIGLKRRTL